MKFTLYFLFICSYLNFSFSQTKLTVTNERGEGIPGAKLEAQNNVYPEDQIKLISTINGEFTVPTSKTLYAVKITSFGYDVFYDTLSFDSNQTIVLIAVQNLEEMCVTAQYQPTSVENAVQKITIIGENQIKTSGANNLADILTYQTGIRLSQDNILGTSMDLAGISGQNVKILIDGVPMIGRQNGNLDVSQINLNNVERIEIVEGPLSVNYGTDALAGTINIITKKPKSKGVTVELNPYYETIGNYNLSGSVAFQLSKHAVTFDGGRNFFDGWTSNDPFIEFPKEKPADTNRVKTWKPKEQYFAGLRYQFVTEKLNLGISGKYFNEMIFNRGMPSAPYFKNAFDDYYHTQRIDGNVTIQNNFKKGNLNTLLAYNDFKRIKNTYYVDLTTLDQVLSQTDGAQDTSRFDQFTGRLIYSSNLLKSIEYQLGADVNYSTGTGRRIQNGQQSIGDFAGFISFEWKVKSALIVKPGLRYAYNTVYKSPLIPSLNLLYRVKKFSFRTSAARGFRSPDLKELYMDFVDINHNITGNPDLLAENSWNYLFFANWIKNTAKNRMFKIEYGAYYNDITNLITLGITADNSYTHINIGDYSTIGQQLSFHFKTKKLSANINATYIGRYNPESETRDVDTYSFSPEVGAKVNYSFYKNRLHANVFYKFNGQLQSFFIDENDEVSTSLQSSYNILDASITADLFAKKQLSITLGAKNILNVQQVNITGQTGGVHSSSSNMNAGRGTSIFLSLRYMFHSNLRSDEK